MRSSAAMNVSHIQASACLATVCGRLGVSSFSPGLPFAPRHGGGLGVSLAAGRTRFPYVTLAALVRCRRRNRSAP
eukprot:5311393-Pleurochrysis_carterae.AAC.2